jgi:hypothetical protein
MNYKTSLHQSNGYELYTGHKFYITFFEDQGAISMGEDEYDNLILSGGPCLYTDGDLFTAEVHDENTYIKHEKTKRYLCVANIDDMYHIGLSEHIPSQSNIIRFSQDNKYKSIFRMVSPDGNFAKYMWVKSEYACINFDCWDRCLLIQFTRLHPITD